MQKDNAAAERYEKIR